jgi:ubiquinone/menaquinone biosynthesis C-methylase UbiE
MGEYPGLDPAERNYSRTRISHWNEVAIKRDRWRGWGRSYHARLHEIYSLLVSPGLRVLEIGCALGDLLVSVRPARAVGVDFSAEMLQRARRSHPGIEFVQADAHDLSSIDERFDVIVLSDLVNDVWDVQGVLQQTRRLCNPSSRVIINFHSGLWQIPLAIAQWINAASPMLAQNWLTPADARGMLRLAGFETIRSWHEILLPMPLAAFANKFLVRFWPLDQLALTNFIVARPQPQPISAPHRVSVSSQPATNRGTSPRSSSGSPHLAIRRNSSSLKGIPAMTRTPPLSARWQPTPRDRAVCSTRRAWARRMLFALVLRKPPAIS